MRKIDRKIFEHYGEKTQKTINKLADSLEQNFDELDPSYLVNLELLAMNYELLYSAYDNIKENGNMTKDMRCRIVRNPSITIFNNAVTTIQNILNKMGFTVASKARVKTLLSSIQESEDEFEKNFLAG